MRFPIAAIFLVIFGFMFLAFFGVGSFLLSETEDALTARATDLDGQFGYEVDIIVQAFGVIGVIMIVLGVVVFVVECFSDEPEYYYRG